MDKKFKNNSQRRAMNHSLHNYESRNVDPWNQIYLLTLGQ